MKSTTINLRVCTETKNRVQELAERKGVSVSEWLLDRPELMAFQGVKLGNIESVKSTNPVASTLPAASASSGSTGRKCIQPNCDIIVEQPVMVHGFRAYLCHLHLS